MIPFEEWLDIPCFHIAWLTESNKDSGKFSSLHQMSNLSKSLINISFNLSSNSVNQSVLEVPFY